MNIIKSSGEKLISELLANPDKFYKQGKAYQLLQEYFHGLPLDTLKPLLSHINGNVRGTAVFVASELGGKAKCLIQEITSLINDPDKKIQWDALESVMTCSTGTDVEKFIFVVKELESSDDSISRLAMRLVSNADLSQLEAGFKLSHTLGPFGKLHEHGLSMLLRGNSITEADIISMLKNPEPLDRIYGAIAAKRLFRHHPKFLEIASSSLDSKISRFSSEALDTLGN
ncbi:MAG: hypothetical protein CTY35_15640 [Methylotenera sp.]|nr:MAG: hypothetical protein CTY35_15640 [Methylotenera sp.]